MDERKEYDARIHYEVEKKLRLLYPDNVLQERFDNVKKELIEKYPDKKKFIESLKVKLEVIVQAAI